jgi:hypothetical protein
MIPECDRSMNCGVVYTIEFHNQVDLRHVYVRSFVVSGTFSTHFITELLFWSQMIAANEIKLVYLAYSTSCSVVGNP